jgi:hypothetical protein
VIFGGIPKFNGARLNGLKDSEDFGPLTIWPLGVYGQKSGKSLRIAVSVILTEKDIEALQTALTAFWHPSLMNSGIIQIPDSCSCQCGGNWTIRCWGNDVFLVHWGTGSHCEEVDSISHIYSVPGTTSHT